jgi:transposase
MEDVLDTYEKPYDPEYPVVNLDESPKQLIEHISTPHYGSDGTVYQDYEYKRNGTVSMYMIIEALRGYREVLVKDDHTALTYADVIIHICRDLYPDAKQITLVEDNLSAHKLAALYEKLPPEQARQMIQRINIVRTPKHGSWLNIAESELSVLTRCGIKKRTPTKELLIEQVNAWQTKRNQQASKVDWQFTTEDARIKLKRLYPEYK